jgi:hypothetical protein
MADAAMPRTCWLQARVGRGRLGARACHADTDALEPMAVAQQILLAFDLGTSDG